LTKSEGIRGPDSEPAASSAVSSEASSAPATTRRPACRRNPVRGWAKKGSAAEWCRSPPLADLDGWMGGWKYAFLLDRGGGGECAGVGGRDAQAIFTRAHSRLCDWGEKDGGGVGAGAKIQASKAFAANGIRVKRLNRGRPAYGCDSVAKNTRSASNSLRMPGTGLLTEEEKGNSELLRHVFLVLDCCQFQHSVCHGQCQFQFPFIRDARRGGRALRRLALRQIFHTDPVWRKGLSSRRAPHDGHSQRESAASFEARAGCD
jgi:hypothetical protein